MAAATIFDRVVFCARETTKGTNGFSTPNGTFASTLSDITTAMGTSAENPDVQAVKVRTVKVGPSMTSIDRPTIKGSMGNSPNIIGKKMVQVDIEFELKGSGAAGTAPEYTPMLEACGVSTTLVTSTSVTFAPATTSLTLTQGVTLRVYHDGMVYDVTGCAGTATVDMTIGNIIIVQATFQGAYNAPTAQTITSLSSVPFDTSTPIVGDVIDIQHDTGTVLASGTATSGSATTLVLTGAGWTVDAFVGKALTVTGLGTVRIISNTIDTLTFATGLITVGTEAFTIYEPIKSAAFKMDLGNDVQEHYVTGDHQFSVANRNPTLTLTKDSVGTATEWTALAAGSNAAIAGTFNEGGAAGNKLLFAAPLGRRSSVAYNERAERDILDVTYGLFESAGGAGNDQWSFQFT